MGKNCWMHDGWVDGVAALRRVKQFLVSLKRAQPFLPRGACSGSRGSIHIHRFRDLFSGTSSFRAQNQCHWGCLFGLWQYIWEPHGDWAQNKDPIKDGLSVWFDDILKTKAYKYSLLFMYCLLLTFSFSFFSLLLSSSLLHLITNPKLRNREKEIETEKQRKGVASIIRERILLP